MGVKISFKFSIANLHSNEFPAAVQHFLRAVLARCGYTLRATSQASYCPEYIAPTQKKNNFVTSTNRVIPLIVLSFPRNKVPLQGQQTEDVTRTTNNNRPNTNNNNNNRPFSWKETPNGPQSTDKENHVQNQNILREEYNVSLFLIFYRGPSNFTLVDTVNCHIFA
jgi:hypothetical protein